VRRCEQFAQDPHTDRAFWQPAKLLARLAAEGESFAAFDAAPKPKTKAKARARATA